MSFLGALLGSLAPVLVGHLQLRSSRRARLDEAYAELNGAFTVLYNVSIPFLFTMTETRAKADDAWVRFGSASTRVRMIEHRTACRQLLDDLTEALRGGLFSTEMSIDEAGEVLMPTREEQGIAHLEKQRRVRWLFDELVDAARE